MWFAAQESFLIIINAEKVVLLNIFVEIMIHFQYFWLIESAKDQHLFEIETICCIINVFTATYDQFNASLLNKIISLKNVVVYTVNLYNYPYSLYKKD